MQNLTAEQDMTNNIQHYPTNASAASLSEATCPTIITNEAVETSLVTTLASTD